MKIGTGIEPQQLYTGRIVVVINDLRPYGSQRVAVALISKWVEAGCEVTIVTLEAASPQDLEVPDAVVVHRLRRIGSRLNSLFSLAYQLRRFLNEREHCVVVAHMTFSNVVALLAAIGRRRLRRNFRRSTTVVVEHSLLTASLGRGLGGQAMAALVHALYPRANAVVAVSAATFADVSRHARVPAERLITVHNPLTSRREPEYPVVHPWLRPHHEHLSLLCVGALREVKGQDVLLRALSLMESVARSRTRLLLIGDGPRLPALEGLAKSLGIAAQVAFVGYRDDASAWMAAADVLVVPSRSESFGLVAIEAARAGTPVLASAVGGLLEVVGHYAPGWLVPAEDPAALADALTALRVPVCAPAVLGSLDDLSAEVVADRYLQVLNRADYISVSTAVVA